MINIIPTPKKYSICSDNICKINLSVYSQKSDWIKYCKLFADCFRNITEVLPSVENGGIEICEDLTLNSDKYTILCKANKITVKASSDEGVLYAVASLLQILNTDKEYFICDELSIEDYPDKEFRGMMLDLAREWHPYNKLFQYVDTCFMYKVKYLHLHFADTNLYTFPSKEFPRLNKEGTYYTETQLRELTEYAELRGVILIPEFETPGHVPILVKNYPDVFGNKYEGDVSDKCVSEQGYPMDPDFILCVGSEKCFEATKTLIREMCDTFPNAPYINVGCDEACIKMWNECPCCREYMAKNGITDVYELYSEYVGRITRYVLSLGKTPIVWEGFPRRGAERIPKETIVVEWESYYNTAPELLQDGFKIINAAWKPLYIVGETNRRCNIKEILDWNVYTWKSWWKDSKAYNTLTVEPTDNVLGAMMCSWEQTYEQEFNYVMENLSAVSEKCWNSEESTCDYEEFRVKFDGIYHKLARMLQER